MNCNRTSPNMPPSRWNLVIQVLIAVLTALSGVFAGCRLC